MSKAKVCKSKPVESVKRFVPETYDYIYLAREREFVRTNTPTYRYGYVDSSNILSKLSDILPKGSEIVLLEKVHSNEDDIIGERLNCHFAQTEECGKNYYTGNVDIMSNIIRNVLNECRLYVKVEDNESDFSAPDGCL